VLGTITVEDPFRLTFIGCLSPKEGIVLIKMVMEKTKKMRYPWRLSYWKGWAYGIK
jgi:hypothetical protein